MKTIICIQFFPSKRGFTPPNPSQPSQMSTSDNNCLKNKRCCEFIIVGVYYCSLPIEINDTVIKTSSFHHFHIHQRQVANLSLQSSSFHCRLFELFDVVIACFLSSCQPYLQHYGKRKYWIIRSKDHLKI